MIQTRTMQRGEGVEVVVSIAHMSETCYNYTSRNHINSRSDAGNVLRPDTRKDKFLMRPHSTRLPYFPENLDDHAPWVAEHGLTAPYGECQCGCGEKTSIATCNDPRTGIAKGEPSRYIRGHSAIGYLPDRGDPNPSGLCHCGCGQITPLAKWNHSRTGVVKGKHLRYMYGHERKLPPVNPRTMKSASDKEWTLEEAWSQYIVRGGVDECWEWQGPMQGWGYGALSFQGQKFGAHRVAYELHNGPIPDGMQVCHTCDNPPCCNPSHLFLGSNDDNVRDRTLKGRSARGERVHNAKLTRKDVVKIRSLVQAGVSRQEIAKRYGITDGYVGRLARRKAWRHVP